MFWGTCEHCEHGGGVGGEQMCGLGFDARDSLKIPLAPTSTWERTKSGQNSRGEPQSINQ